MRTVFQASILSGAKNILFLLGVPTFILIILCKSIGRSYKGPFWKCLKYLKGRELLVLSFILVIELLVLFHTIDAGRHVLLAYISGQYQTVTGVVTEYKPPASSYNPYEEFQVNGIHFSYSPGDITSVFGYDKTALNGGVITKNGLFVEVLYVRYGFQNVIVQIDICDKVEE